MFYRDGNKLMAVDVTGSDSLTLSQPHVLFERDFGNASITIPNYDVGPNGRSFVVVKNESELSRLDVVLNWFTELKRLAPATPP